MYGQDDGTNYCNWNATDTKYTGAAVAEAVTDICKSSAMVNCVNEDAQAFALNGQMIADVNGHGQQLVLWRHMVMDML